jgi:DNA polymerase-4
MDAFFVAVELLDRPGLRGRPVVVGGTGPRGVVASASYEARARGVRSAQPTALARRLCPDAVFLPGRYERYAEVSGRIMEVFRSFTPLVEPISLDEAFLDVSGSGRSLGPAPGIAAAVRDHLRREEGLDCSVGVGPSKLVAKLASAAAKPEPTPSGPRPGPGVVVVTDDEVRSFLHRLPLRALWGVGPATLDRLERLGVTDVAGLASLSLDVLVGTFGHAQGRHLHDLARGIDDRPVVPDRSPRSIGHEETFPRDLRSRAALHREVVRLADAVASRLRAHGTVGRTVTLKVRFGDFRTITRSTTLTHGVDTAAALIGTAERLLDAVDPSPGVRLLGLTVTGLGAARQLPLELGGEGPSDAARGSVARAVDEIRGRFGPDAIGPAALVDGAGLRIARRGLQARGPGAGPGPDPCARGPERRR